jgi:hypothetical protein
VPLGSPTMFMPESMALFPISATVEPDADHDGFGDETQDKCPTDPSTQGTCPPPSPDKTAPVLSSSSKSAKLSRKGAISFTLTTGENATGSATGTISLPKAGKVVRFKTTKLQLTAGKPTKVTLKLSTHNAKAVRKALKHHKLKARVTVTVKDPVGNETVKRLGIKLKH